MVEKTETNESPLQEAEKAPSSRSARTTKSKTDNETMALSVKNQSQAIALPGNRPIEASHLKVVSTYNSVGGNRPIVASGLDVAGTLTVSGSRPIIASHLKISDTYTVMGNRPVASNEIDDPLTLMGFLD